MSRELCQSCGLFFDHIHLACPLDRGNTGLKCMLMSAGASKLPCRMCVVGPTSST